VLVHYSIGSINVLIFFTIIILFIYLFYFCAQDLLDLSTGADIHKFMDLFHAVRPVLPVLFSLNCSVFCVLV